MTHKNSLKKKKFLRLNPTRFLKYFLFVGRQFGSFEVYKDSCQE